MKKKFLIIVFTIIVNIAFSQNTFELTIDKDKGQRIYAIAEDEFGDFIVGTTEFTPDNFNCMVYKVSSIGKALDSIMFIDENYHQIKDVICVDTNEFFIIGVNYSGEIEDMHMWIMKINSNLDILWNKKFLTGKSILRINSKKTSKNRIAIYGGYEIDNNAFSTFLIELNSDGEIIKSFTSGEAFGGITFINEVVEKPGGNGYIIFQYNWYKIIEIDSNFNITYEQFDLTAYTDGHHMMPISNNSFWLTDTSYVISGLKPNTEKDLSLIVSDTTHNALYDFVNITPYYDNLAFFDNMVVTSNGILLLGTLNFSYDYFETTPNQLILFNFDDTLGLNWQKTFGGDAYYNATNIIATQDGGCLIAATRSDSSNFQDYDMYFLKLDSLGTLTHINGKPVDMSSDFAVYPTSATDFINIKKGVQIKQADFILYNSAGQKTLQSTLNQDITTLNTSHLQKGVYVYNILINGKIVDRGKTIIE